MALTPHRLAGQLLLAHPGLADPNFRRSIIHVMEHDDHEGTIGFILNRPTGQTLGDLAGRKLARHLARTPVYLGGPVAPGQVIIARLRWNPATNILVFSTDAEEDEDALGHPEGELRAFLGYSGWGKQQLARELREGSWLVHAPHPSTSEANTDTWKGLVSDFGPQYRLLAGMPDDPGLN